MALIIVTIYVFLDCGAVQFGRVVSVCEDIPVAVLDISIAMAACSSTRLATRLRNRLYRGFPCFATIDTSISLRLREDAKSFVKVI
jgi:hypothetical protein